MIKLRHKKTFHPVPSPLLYIDKTYAKSAKKLNLSNRQERQERQES